MREMRILTNTGVAIVRVEEPEQASTIGRFWNAVKESLGTGDDWALHDFAGTVIDGLELETDPDLIEDFALAGQLGFRDIYAS